MRIGLHVIRRATTAITMLALAAGAGTASGTTSRAGQAVFVNDIVVAADYGTSHVVYATGAEMGCQTSCTRLLRSDDAGASWAAAVARGWPGGSVTSVPAGRGEVLVSGTDRAIGTLRSRGEAFEQAADGGGTASAVGVAGGVEVAAVSAGTVVTVRLPGNVVTRYPAPALGTNATVLLGPGYPAARGASPAAFVAGSDPATGMPAIARCDAKFACAPAVVVPNDRKDVARVFAAPHVDRDGVVAVLPTNGALNVSTDGAKSFQRVTVRPLVPGDVTVAVQDVAFTHDFDLAARKGTAYAAVIAVHKDANEKGSTSGAVYRSSDLRTWQKVGAASPLDAGATSVAVAPDGRVFASYLDITTKSGGVVCTTGTSWGACAAYRAGATAPLATTAPGSTTEEAAGPTPPPAQESRGSAASSAPGRAKDVPAERADGTPVRGRASSAPLLLGLLGALTAAGAGTVFVRRRTRAETGAGDVAA